VDVFLVTIHTDPILREMVSRPMVFMEFPSMVAIPKDAVVCDACNARVGVTEEEVEELGYLLGMRYATKRPSSR